MNGNYFNVVVAKDYESNEPSGPTKKTAWNRIGRAWISKAGNAMNLELFMMPNQRYVIQLLNEVKSND